MKLLRFNSKELVTEDGLDNGHILDSFINQQLPERLYSTELICSYLLISQTEPDLEFYRDYREVFPLAGSYNPYRIKETKIEREIRISKRAVLRQNDELSGLNSVLLASVKCASLRANSITANCIPKHIPK